jgi:hypothetical protein
MNISAQEINAIVGNTLSCEVEHMGIEVDNFLKRKNPLTHVFIKKDSNKNWIGVSTIKNDFLAILIKTKTNALNK